MKLLLFGADGQVGWELQRALAPLGELVVCSRRAAIADLKVDLSDSERLRHIVLQRRPDVIVNAAAYTHVDLAESERAQAEAVNASAPGVLAEAASRTGARLVHYSTDYVFDGSGQHARDESSLAAPINAYGDSKLRGEQAITASGCAHLVFRTSWVYGSRGSNFARTMLRLAREREHLKVVADQVGAPTCAALLADLTAHALIKWKHEPGIGGLYHCTAAGHISWHGYARFVLNQALQRGVQLKAGPDDVLAIDSRQFAAAARRPLNSRLDCRRFEAAFGLRLPSWQHGVLRWVDEWAGTLGGIF